MLKPPTYPGKLEFKLAILAYLLCFAGFVWIGFENMAFRKSIRTTLADAQQLMESVDPDARAGLGKILNSYYESVYNNLPSTVAPASMLMFGATLILLYRFTPK